MTFGRGPNEMDPVQLTIHVELSANFNNLQSIAIDLWPQNNPNWANSQDGRQTWVNIPRKADAGNIFEATITLSPYATEADYVARVLNLTDDQGNFVNVTNTQLDELGLQSSALLANAFADNLSPRITSIEIGSAEKLADGTIAIPVDLVVTDNKSGIISDDVIIEFIGPNSANFQQRVMVDAQGHVSQNIILPQYVASGTYVLGTVRVYDYAGNGVMQYNADQHGGVGSVIIDNPDQDIAPPTLDRLEITGRFDPVNGRPVLHLSADLSDDKAGLGAFWARTYVNGASVPSNERVTSSTGHVEFDFALVSPSATGIYSFELTAVDNARNVQWWQSDLRNPGSGLSTLGFIGDIHVYAPDEAGYVGATVQGGATDSVIFGLAKDDTLNAGKGADQLLGGAGNDTLNGGGGGDYLYAGSGNDTVNAGSGNDLIVGGDGAGDDTYNGGSGIDTVKYTSARDGIVVDLAAGSATSRAGGDAAGIGTDKLTLVEGVIAGFHDDLVAGSDLANRLQGMDGNDVLDGRGGNDRLEGGAGNDVLVGGTGNDILVGGTGTDTADYAGAAAGVKASLALSGAQATGGAGIDTLSSIESLAGSAFADRLEGGRTSNRLLGGAGSDTLMGLGGADRLDGGAGNDKLYGGEGKDTLTGGAGKDRFVFDTAPSSRDTITDFHRAEGDKIQLSKAVFKGFAYTGTLHAEDFYAAAGATKAQDATDRVIYDTTTGILYYDADGTGGAAAVQVALLGASTHPALAYGDILIGA